MYLYVFLSRISYICSHPFAKCNVTWDEIGFVYYEELNIIITKVHVPIFMFINSHKQTCGRGVTCSVLIKYIHFYE